MKAADVDFVQNQKVPVAVTTVMKALFRGSTVKMDGYKVRLVNTDDGKQLVFMTRTTKGTESYESVLGFPITLKDFFDFCEKMPEADLFDLQTSLALSSINRNTPCLK